MLAKSLLEVSDTDMRGGPLCVVVQQVPEMPQPGIQDRQIEELKRLIIGFQHEFSYEHMLLRAKIEEFMTPKPSLWKRFLNWIRSL